MRAEQWMTAAARAILMARLRNAAGQDRRVVRFAHDDPCLGTLVLQYARYASEGAARAESGYPVIQRKVREVAQDLHRGRARMRVGVGRVLKLPRPPPAVPLRQLLRLRDHAGPFLCSWCQHYLRAQKAHQL